MQGIDCRDRLVPDELKGVFPAVNGRVNASEWIDAHAVSGFQVAVFILLGLSAAVEGYDAQAMGYVAPVILHTLHVAPAALGAIIAMAPVGMAIGALVAGPVADRIGRKPVLIGGLTIFGVFSLLTAQATTVPSFMFYRLVSGFAIGGCMPNSIALTAEYAPTRWRRTLVNIMFDGFPVGAVVGGLVAARLLIHLGWPVVFVVGGISPLVVALLLLGLLPESLRFMVHHGGQEQRIAAVLNRIHPDAALRSAREFYLSEERLTGFSVFNLFRPGLATTTILLWITFFVTLFLTWMVSNWTPSLLAAGGVPLKEALYGTMALQGGGVVGGILVGYGSDVWHPKRVLIPCYGLAALSLLVAGWVHGVGPVLVTLFLLGMFNIGGQNGINALAASVYPTDIRSTGVGWALGVGRLGAIIGPLLGGVLVGAHWSLPAIFAFAAVPTVIGGLALFGVRVQRGPTVAAQHASGTV